METKIYCQICGAENEMEEGGPLSCYNCDNPLERRARASATSNGPVDQTVNRLFACSYLAIFAISSVSYLLSLADLASTSSPTEFLLLIPILFHLTWIKWAKEINGVYKGKNRFIFLRSLILYSVVALTIYELATSKAHVNKDRVGLTFLMLFSLILFYSYFFGKKDTIFNHFKFS